MAKLLTKVTRRPWGARFRPVARFEQNRGGTVQYDSPLTPLNLDPSRSRMPFLPISRTSR